MVFRYLLPSGGQGVEHDIRAGKRGQVGIEGKLQGGQLLWIVEKNIHAQGIKNLVVVCPQHQHLTSCYALKTYAE